ncbi:23S rRNA (guanosine(2251)-2'-O)-methyltransferase RlmB [Asticcacaulis sp. EMRT-3]|uniref:23S rRNA (guanosine(2251)-2'-O)-methyltransferase RlmB n=1 Tax=Asticcacaulis sp. EMRT-3 TaxID=3040349 RepID=UPI0024AF9D23|nr:23S rRNA (guanosine(2251)-2'-O)-methyltransferase RlmB [Asticcacaulis sp. EMRT-3]MDI7774610.1 23S rRNA (guanosine(2251)-2'-O)-methyltransferase RlmB [Asticcacaulis sp. EMRT-3]
MSSFRERNDPKRHSGKNRAQNFAEPAKPVSGKPRSDDKNAKKLQHNHKHKTNDEGWIWGVHAVLAALKNPRRQGPIRLFLSEDRSQTLAPELLKRADMRLTTLPGAEIARLLPQGAVHQGMALHAPVPEGDSLDSLMEAPAVNGVRVLLMLDQVTDPQNIGAIFRSAAAFGVSGLIMQDRHAPPLQGVLAKTAAGAIDAVPFARVTNLSRALESLNEAGYISIGLAGEGESNLHDLLFAQNWREGFDKLVLVLGSEGDGIRRLVAEHCDHLARIPMPGGFESLNVSHAASIALYEACARIAAPD